MDIVFQPIVAAATLHTVGVEALARFRGDRYAGPAQWFAAAGTVERGVRLELLAIGQALEAAVSLPADQYLAINVGPATLMAPDLMPLLLGSTIAPARLVLELTEHAPVSDYTALREARRTLHEHEIRLAIDDVGAGYSSLRHVLALQPDFIKLDCTITVDVDSDQGRQALITGILLFARSQALTIIAEGVETREQRQVLADLGVDQLQGEFLGAPQPPSSAR